MNIEYGQREWDPADFDALRQSLEEAQVRAGLSWAEIARQAQVAPSTLSQFRSGAYRGDNTQVAQSLMRWLDAHNTARAFRLKAPPEPTFVQTSAATKVHAALQHAQLLNDTAVVVGPPGAGKTAAISAYKAQTPLVYLVTASPAISSPQAVLGEFIRLYCPDWNPQSVRGMAARSTIVRRTLTKGALLVIDEAQHLTVASLEELRAIHDDRRCGFVLSGNTTVLRRIQGASRDPAYAQLFGRVGWRAVLPRASEADVRAVLETMSVDAAEVVAVALEILKKEDLRVVIKVTRSALLLSHGSNENLEPKHMRAAYRQLSGDGGAS